MEIAVLIFIIIVIILCHKLSAAYSKRVEEKYGEGCINWWWSIGIASLLTAALLTIGQRAFWIFLLLTLGVAVLSAWFCYRKMIGWGAAAREAGLGGAAQMASAIGIAAAVVLILLLLFSGSGKKRRRR